MTIEAWILTHVATLFAGVAGTYAYLRNVAGWSTAFETKISAEVAHLWHLLGTATGQAAPPQAPVTAVPPVLPPVAGGTIPVSSAHP
jgi:hypothetical protein